MPPADLVELLGPELASALNQKGYERLTPVQEAVLDPALADRDLRISSQTGSGKTLAIGFTLRHAVTATTRPADGIARPFGVVVTPTRELAKQVELELAWLYAPSRVLVTSVTGGTSMRDDFRSLARGPGILVGTPGRLLDHLTRGAVDLATTRALVLDEADRMLDLGFKEDIEAIFALAPASRRSHLVSATFPREVEALARRVQTDPARVEGTPLGTANADIDHVIHVVKAGERTDALINLLLAAPDEQVLAFARTRADVTHVCEELDAAGFAVDSLSGEMEQGARHRALGAFKRGDVQILVATDVAARGIDHSEIARVVQLEPPNDSDTYTHRSGRTGRAGRKGKSSIMVQPAGIQRLSALLKRAGVKYRFAPIPTAASIAQAQDEKLVRELCGEVGDEIETIDASDTSDGGAPGRPVDARAQRIAAELVASGRAELALTTLIERLRQRGTATPRDITPWQPPPQHPERGHATHGRAGHDHHAPRREHDRKPFRSGAPHGSARPLPAKRAPHHAAQHGPRHQVPSAAARQHPHVAHPARNAPPPAKPRPKHPSAALEGPKHHHGAKHPRDLQRRA
ncbi:MAG TPA: DEAD/DEAH box helicase [Polyangiaceae bacterium]|nr:DEAD/DEAH box helicase [Polyangiaceae bacterium]